METFDSSKAVVVSARVPIDNVLRAVVRNIGYAATVAALSDMLLEDYRYSEEVGSLHIIHRSGKAAGASMLNETASIIESLLANNVAVVERALAKAKG